MKYSTLLQKGRKNTQQSNCKDNYTPKKVEFQVILAFLTIFVNYADFYVNIIMSTV